MKTNNMNRVDLIKHAFRVDSHPEGGCFKELYMAAVPEGQRSHLCSTLFMLDKTEISHFHQLDCDELWLYHEGCGLKLVLWQNGLTTEYLLGKDYEKDQCPAVLVPKGAVFGASNLDPEGYTFLSVVTSPAFTYEGFHLVTRDELCRIDPEFAKKYGHLAYEKIP